MNNYNYKIIIKLLVYQILVITILFLTSFVDFNYISQRFYTSFESDKLEYFKTIKKVVTHLATYYFLLTIYAYIYFNNIKAKNIIHEEIIANTILYNFFFALTTIAFTFLFGIKDKTLELMFPNDKLLQWDFNLILYWCTGFISIIFLYFKQLKEKWENYIFEKKIECTDTNNKHE